MPSILALAAAIGAVGHAGPSAPIGELRGAPRLGAPQAGGLGTLPLHFERNEGQADSRVKFLARGNGFNALFTPTDVLLALRRTEGHAGDDARRKTDRRPARGTTSTAVVRMRLVGGSPRAEITGKDELPGKSHYLTGSDPRRWRTNVPLYARVRYRDVYPGVDLDCYGNEGELEYDFVVSPGADPGVIRLGFEGSEAVTLDGSGNLVLETNAGRLLQAAPLVYQQVAGERRPVAGRYVRRGPDEVGFSIGAYDAALPLVIDPVLKYSTYMGGNGNDWGLGIGVDGSGNIYVAGSTMSTDFPTQNPHQATPGGSEDVYVTKLSPSGSTLLYSTYLGGGGDDIAFGLAVDSSGAAYVAGETESADFPTQGPYQAAYAGGYGDAFAAKLSPSGSTLVYSTYIGGDSPDVAYGIAVDAAGSAYLTGETFSSDFPTQDPFQGTNQGTWGAEDAFVTKLSPSGSALVYSTYLGGDEPDIGWDIAVDSSGAAYVAGDTTSLNFPTLGPYQAAHRGGYEDGFVTKVSPSGSALVYSTYLGGSEADWAYGIAIDPSQSAYVTGCTGSTDFPTLSAFQPTLKGSCDVFVTRLSPSGSALVYSTYLGGSAADVGWRVALDASGSAYVTGYVLSTDFPTVNPYQAALGGQADAFVAKLSPSGSSLLYSTYLGGSAYDYGNAIAVDGSGSFYLAGDARSTDFPTLGAYQATNGGLGDAFVAKFVQGQDLLWHNQANGDLYAWSLDGTVAAGGSYLDPSRFPDTRWQIRARADFDGDGQPDILWHHETSGDLYVWRMSGLSAMGGSYLSPSRIADTRWQVRAAVDLNGDGKTDLLWHHQATGELYAWFLNGTTVGGGSYLSPSRVADTRWQIRGAVDLNHDRRPDLLWHNQATGELYVWFLDGVATAGSSYLTPSRFPDTSWQVQRLVDLNADGQPDLLWRHRVTGDLYAWLLNGVTTVGGSYLTPRAVADASWQIVPR